MKNINFKKFTLILIDFLILAFSGILAVSLLESAPINFNIYFLSSFIAVFILWLTKVYLSIQSNINLNKDYWKFLLASISNSILIYLCASKTFFIVLLSTLLSFLVFLASRYIWKGLKTSSQNNSNPINNVAIYGAGDAGLKLSDVINVVNKKNVKFFVDDNKRIQGRTTKGIPIIGRDNILEMLQIHKVNELIIAIPSASNKERTDILNFISAFPVKLSTAPDLDQITEKKDINNLKTIPVEDALGRKPVEPNFELIHSSIGNKVVLVTGAGGSIGSELCRQIVAANPDKILILDSSEFALYKIDQELHEYNDPSKIHTILGSVTSKDLLENIFQKNNIDIIFHAAAYKHVPIVEDNIIESTKNNIIGMLNLSEYAEKYKVKNFVLISSDKAVRTTNIMGATKRICELILQAKSDLSKEIKYSMVRFGNVLDSSGSVFPLFRKQIESGGPLTLTHKEITRYFMTIKEAAQLVIQSASLSSHGDVFVLDMGEPIKIIDLARFMIHSNGFVVADEETTSNKPQIEIKITGLRPGEKLYEELIIEDNAEPTAHPKIMRAKDTFLNWNILSNELDQIDTAIKNRDEPKLREVLMELAYYGQSR